MASAVTSSAPTGDLIFTTYFSGLRDDHRRKVVPSDKRRFIEPWWRSLLRLPVQGVVFHNNLSAAFVRNHSTPHIRFERVDAAAHYARGLSLNDLRFFVYLDKLRAWPNVRRVWLTDARDVWVMRDPFAPATSGYTRPVMTSVRAR